jgi:hypothetical protein
MRLGRDVGKNHNKTQLKKLCLIAFRTGCWSLSKVKFITHKTQIIFLIRRLLKVTAVGVQLHLGSCDSRFVLWALETEES